MEFPKTSIEVSRGLTYSYIHIPPTTSTKPYVLLLHGFPSLPIDYHSQITHLSSLGYGILAPELLGYGDTSRPADSDPYRLKLMAADIIDILDHHSIPQVLAIGHDWGVSFLTRIEFYYPDRIAMMALLAIGPAAIGTPFDIHAINSMMKEKLGYEGFGYMLFFTQDPDAPSIINSHQTSFRSLIFCPDAEIFKPHFGSIGGMKRWLLSDTQGPVIEGFNDEKILHDHKAAFATEKGGYTASLNWYRNHVAGTNTSDELYELKARGGGGSKTYQTTKPLLQILSGRDPIALAPIHKQMAEAYAPGAKIETFDVGHWVMLEAPQETDKALEEFFARHVLQA